MKRGWKWDTMFPIIERVIRDLWHIHRDYIPAHRITSGLLKDNVARPIIEAAQKAYTTRLSLKGVAGRMVGWFSARITDEEKTKKPKWGLKVKRVMVDGEWAYKPADEP